MTRSTLAVVVAALTLAACGGAAADGEVTTTATPAETTTDAATDAATDDTVADTTPETTAGEADVPAVPEAYGDEVRAVEVIGDPLPEYAGSIEGDPAIGMVAPGLVGEDYTGAPVVAAHGTDRATLVVFLAHWCPHCNDEVPELNALRDAGRFPDELDIVAVSTAIAPDRPNFPPSRWIVEKDWTYPVIADELDMSIEAFTAATAYGVTGFPFMTLVGADGTVLARWSGSAGADAIEALVTGLLDQPADA
jgi:thiol-disulfide isomerase/thioredoxin